MATTNFNGPVNSVEGFQVNGLARSWAGTRVIYSAGDGSVVMLASYAGLSTVEWGIALPVDQSTGGASKVIACIETSKNGVVGSSASFQVSAKNSSDSTMTAMTDVMGSCTIDCILIGAA